MKTGKIRFRKSMFGKLILQVEEHNTILSYKETHSWRDAKVTDLSKEFMPIIIQKKEVI